MRFSFLLALSAALASPAVGGERTLIDDGWRFHLGDAPGAEAADYDHSSWRQLDLPHNWSIEHPTEPDAPSAGPGGYHRMGVGWYRRELPPATDGERLSVEFEGCYGDTQVWLNGERLGKHLYGYTPFALELPDARADGPNVIAVRVDNSAQPNCRWYSGSGLYRHVWLRRSGEITIEPESVWLKTLRLSDERVLAEVVFSVENTGDAEQAHSATVSLFAPSGQQVTRKNVGINAPAGGAAEATVRLEIDEPESWTPESPALYELRVELTGPEGKPIDKASQRVGLRTVEVNAERGFLLNGEPVVLYGGNVHHDHGPLGAASYDAAERRRATLLKRAGFNAIRTSHNPPAEAFLDACDELGLLVIDEAFDGWRASKLAKDYGDHFDEIWRDELSAMVRRDRRHPSVVMWSIGNEMYERGKPSGVRYAHALADHVRELDPTRPVTAGVNGLGERPWSELDPLLEPLGACGYNYEIGRYAADHQRLPRRVMYGSETYPVDVFKSWRATTTQPWVVGDFVWSAIDYLGEAGIGRAYPAGEEPKTHWEAEHYPWRGAACGDIDLVGQRKPISYYRNIVWDRGETLYAWVVDPAGQPWSLTPWATEPARADWTWNVGDGTPLTVRAASRWPRVRLMLNDEPVGEADAGEENEFLASFSVPYRPGELVAIGLDRQGAERERVRLTTAGPAARLELRAEAPSVSADRQSIVQVDAAVVDARGRVQPLEEKLVRFEVAGPAELIAVGSADLTSPRAYTGDRFETHQGRMQAVLRGTGLPGEATLTATAEGLPPRTARVSFTD
ncbi:glycoside hydrolase family 2 TIM barrel-domain containing protein [Botrimarina sp.]|uniref:glycoside hydrolase family 2 TIM barrel-domain containing protein n=1 Tax=Botrimarina sp. TaxID=2795802 RepID=UPI0032EE4113